MSIWLTQLTSKKQDPENSVKMRYRESDADSDSGIRDYLLKIFEIGVAKKNRVTERNILRNHYSV